MVAKAITQETAGGNIRPFRAHRDLAQLANLIEIAFQAELDWTAASVAAELRRLARLSPLLWLLLAPHALLGFLLGGYVWIEEGQLVGNVSLTVDSQQRGVWIISNVAVHPDFRRRHIARELMDASLQEAVRHGARWVLLEVRADNSAAQQLYRELGFEVYDTTIELSLPEHRWPHGRIEPSLQLRRRLPGDAHSLYHLAEAATTAETREVRPISPHRYAMGLGHRLLTWLDDVLNRRKSLDWVLELQGRIVALLQLTGNHGRTPHRLQVTVHPRSRGPIEKPLLAAGLSTLQPFPRRRILSTISMSHPEAQEAFREAGFEPLRVLDQLRLDLRHTTDWTVS